MGPRSREGEGSLRMPEQVRTHESGCRPALRPGSARRGAASPVSTGQQVTPGALAAGLPASGPVLPASGTEPWM